MLILEMTISQQLKLVFLGYTLITLRNIKERWNLPLFKLGKLQLRPLIDHLMRKIRKHKMGPMPNSSHDLECSPPNPVTLDSKVNELLRK
jgi:hypothetical protein